MTGAAELGDALRFFAITLYLAVLAVWLATYLRSAGADAARRRRLRRGRGASSPRSPCSPCSSPTPGTTLLTGESATRAQGLFKDPNVFGPFLVPAALILLEESLRPRLLGLRRPTSVALLAVLVLGVVFAYSRAGWLNLAVAVVVMLVVMALRADAGRARRRRSRSSPRSARSAARPSCSPARPGSSQERAQVQAYDTERFSAQRSGVKLARGAPARRRPGPVRAGQSASPPTASTSACWPSRASLGLAVLVALLAGTLALAVGNALAGRDAYGVGSAALLGAWCGLLANSAFVDTLHWRHLWLVAALIWVAAMRARR